MDSPKVTATFSIIFFFFFFFFLLSMSTKTKACSVAVCNQTSIQFPFRVTDQQPYSCGYPGFELSCDSADQTVLRLPYSGEFSVQSINYYRQELSLNDPKNCLPQKLLSLNLSGSPFVGKYYDELTFYNCSSLDYFYVISPISCLSHSNYTIYATSSAYTISLLSAKCNLIKKISIPVPWPYSTDVWSTALNQDLWLTWDTPDCRGCDYGGRRCGFKSKSSLETKCFDFPSDHGVLWKTRNEMAVYIGVIMFLGLVWFLCARAKKINGREEEATIEFTSTTIASQPSITTGLDGPTLESYPRVILGESRRLPNPNDETCSICISAYKPKETLKSIPKCNHCFHADCIDEWLHLNSTCPVCRNSPEKEVPGPS